MLALAEERFWWLKMVEDCQALVKGCQRCQIFEGAVVKAPLYPIKAFAPLELVHVDFTSIETTMELNQPPSVKNVLVITDHFTRYSIAFVTKDQKAKTVMHECCMNDSYRYLVHLLSCLVIEERILLWHW